MRKQFLTASLLALITFGTACSNSKNDPNIVSRKDSWRPTTDSYGSTLDTGRVMIDAGVLSVSFTMEKKTGEEWPYVELISSLGQNMENTYALSVTYKCDKPLILKLAQPDFGPNGTATYAHYQYTLPASSEWNTAEVKISNFEQPDWASQSCRQIPLKESTVQEVYFVPLIDPFVGGSATLKLKHFEVKDL